MKKIPRISGYLFSKSVNNDYDLLYHKNKKIKTTYRLLQSRVVYNSLYSLLVYSLRPLKSIGIQGLKKKYYVVLSTLPCSLVHFTM